MDYSYLNTIIFDTFYDMLSGRYTLSGKDIAVKYFRKDTVVEVTYEQMIRESACIFGYFAKRQIKDVNIAIFSAFFISFNISSRKK